LKVKIVLIKDLLNKDPSKRMTIKEVLDHSWIQKFTKNKVADMRRISKNSNNSNFSIYTTTNEDLKSNNQ
jgi:serine/threonine protein kinase